MTIRPLLVAVLAGLACAVALPLLAQADRPLTSEAALTLVERPPWSTDPYPTPEQLAEARRVLEAAAAREPGNDRWAYGLAHTERLAVVYAGAERKQKMKEIQERFERLVERNPRVAGYHYWLGKTCFDRIDDVSFLGKRSLAIQGRTAFERAIELDPRHVAALYALGKFYDRAPSIVGGGTAKAKAQGQALLKLPERRGEYWGRMLLAEIAAEHEDWTEMSRQYTAAEAARAEPPRIVEAFRAHISRLLTDKEDPAAALPVIARYRAFAGSDDTAVDVLEGDAKRQLGQCSDAVVAYARALAKNESDGNARYGIAQCHEQLGNRAEAIEHYRELARRFPRDSRAAKAREALRRLGD